MFAYSVIVDRGAVREANDDRALAGNLVCNEGCCSGVTGESAIFAVGDGVGSCSGGGKAAAIALSCLSQLEAQDINEVGLRSALAKADESICAEQRKDDRYGRMCTTIAGVAFGADCTVTFNAGDSRVYRIRNGIMAQLTTDHTEAQEKIDIGLVEDTFEYREENSVITRCLGGRQMPAPDVDSLPVRPFGEDRFLLCSDGLWAYVDGKTICGTVIGSASKEDACEKLYRLAVERGSTDNVTVMIVEYIGAQEE